MWSPELGEEARWYAREFCRLYGIRPPVQWEELLAAVRARGCPVYHERMTERGLFVPLHREPFIVIRDWGDVWALAHETFHFLVVDRIGLEMQGYPEECVTPEEWAAKCFAWLLCSEKEHAREVLRGTRPIPIPGAALPNPRVPAPSRAPLGAVAYVWTPREKGAGGSIATARQSWMCQAWCRQRDLPLEGVFLDHGDPWGPPLRRPGVDQLLSEAAELRRQRRHLLLLPHLSRLGPLEEMRSAALGRLRGIGFEIRNLNAPEWKDPWR